jgi:hypothetical protein
MLLRLTRIRSLAFATLVGTAAVGLLISAFCALEYQYAQHYFTVQHLWYLVSFPWNSLGFAFPAACPTPESTLLAGCSSGVGGATVWWCMSRLRYSRGVAFSVLAAFATAHIASLIAWAATFEELLVTQTSQALIVIAFFTLVPRKKSTYVSDSHHVQAQRGLRFSTRDLLILTALIGSLLALARHIDFRFVNVALLNNRGHINLWLPILGASTGIVTLLFASSYQARGRLRVALLALAIPLAAAFGYGLALIFPMLPILWSFYTGSYAVGTFQYFPPAYAVWLVLTGLLSVLTLGLIRVAARLSLRLPCGRDSRLRAGSTPIEECGVICRSR